MKETERVELEKKSDLLRIHLKRWEKNFASANDGRKASREDIKKHSDIGTVFILPQSIS